MKIWNQMNDCNSSVVLKKNIKIFFHNFWSAELNSG